MATTHHSGTRAHDAHRAVPMGLFVTALGAIALLVSLWLDWITTGRGDSEANPASGYEADGVIPLLVFLAIGFTVSLGFARFRADRSEHRGHHRDHYRGLALASGAVGLAGLLWTVAFAIDPISTIQYPDRNVSIEAGLWLGIIGTLLWTVGSYLVAMEPDEDVRRTPAAAPTAVPGTTHPGHTTAHHDQPLGTEHDPGSYR